MAVPQYPYPVVGGLERQAHELAKALIELGIEVQVVSGRIESQQPTQDWVEGVRVHRIPWSPRKYVRFIRSPLDLLKVLYARRHSYDLVHLHQFSWFGLFIILVARLLGKPVLTKLPNVGEYGLPGLAASRLGPLKLAIFRQTDAVVAMSRESLGELAAIGYPSCRVLRTPNGIRLSTHGLHSGEGTAASGICRVGFVGRLKATKGIDDLLHAWQHVLSSSSVAVQLEVWGSGLAESELKELAVRLGIADSVFFRGYVGSVRDRLKYLDVLVMPSLFEGNSNAVLEAMAAGLPVVSTRVGGTPMLVGDTGAHFLVEPGDRQGLYSRLLELVEDERLRRRIGAAMRQRILTNFDMRLVAGRYAAAYTMLATGRRDLLGEIGDPIIAEA